MGAMTFLASKQEPGTGKSGRFLTDDPQSKLRAERLGRISLELDAYEHLRLYQLASQNLANHLDHGVKVNYPEFGKALKSSPEWRAQGE